MYSSGRVSQGDISALDFSTALEYSAYFLPHKRTRTNLNRQLFRRCLIEILFFPQICFWLLDNGFRVMIAACDTFRAGAVEQLRTHVRHLNALHPPVGGSGPPSVLLYEKGYGKDAASIAMDAINFGELDS